MRCALVSTLMLAAAGLTGCGESSNDSTDASSSSDGGPTVDGTVTTADGAAPDAASGDPLANLPGDQGPRGFRRHRTGGAVISSQYLGRRDGEKAAKSAAQLYTVLAVSTIAVMLVILVLSRPILRIVFGRIDDDVMSFSQTYFLISAISYPFIGFYNAGAALFRAQGNSRISMLASLVMKTNAQMGAIMNIVVGIVGAWLGGVLAGMLGFAATSTPASLIVSIIGACLLIALLKAVKVLK